MADRTLLSPTVLARDAANRALRTLVQQAVALGLLAAVATVTTALTAGKWPDVRLALGAGVTAAMAPVLSYVHRRFVDASSVPSELPPGEPKTS